EDGIRDGHVTGVQTCALPIFPREYSGRRIWSDGVRKTLEAKLPDLLANIEGRAAEAEERRLEREREERERERAWEQALELAREQIGRASCRERVESARVEG